QRGKDIVDSGFSLEHIGSQDFILCQFGISRDEVFNRGLELGDVKLCVHFSSSSNTCGQSFSVQQCWLRNWLSMPCHSDISLHWLPSYGQFATGPWHGQSSGSVSSSHSPINLKGIVAAVFEILESLSVNFHVNTSAVADAVNFIF